MSTSHHTDLVAVGPDEGTRYEFLNNLATVRVAADGSRSMSVVEFLAPHGFGPPMHNHTDEDELFIVFDGELRLFSGDRQIEAKAGAVAYLPRAVPHTFIVVSEQARFVNVTTTGSEVAPRFDEMVAALGTVTTRSDVPEPAYIDPTRVAEVCAAHGIDIVGPPPTL